MSPAGPEKAPRPKGEVRGFGRRPREDDLPEPPQPSLKAVADILAGRSPLQTARHYLRQLLAGGRLTPQDQTLAANADACFSALELELRSISAMVAHGMRLQNVVDCAACQVGFHKECTKVAVTGTEPCYCRMNAHKPHKNAQPA